MSIEDIEKDPDEGWVGALALASLVALVFGIVIGHFLLPRVVENQVSGPPVIQCDRVKKCIDSGGSFFANDQGFGLEASCSFPQKKVPIESL